MKYKKTEKEIIQALVKYEGNAVTIADALTQSNILERHGGSLQISCQQISVFLLHQSGTEGSSET